MNFLDGAFPGLDEAVARDHNERLTQRMGMPGGSGARLERDARTLRPPSST